MAFTWLTPEEKLNGITYSIVFLPSSSVRLRVRLRITGTGDIPGLDQYRPWANFHYSLDEIWIGEGICSIGSGAFSDIPYLNRIWLPDTLTSIADGAFDQCPNLEIIVYGGTPAQLQAAAIPTGAIPDWFDLEGEENEGGEKYNGL